MSAYAPRLFKIYCHKRQTRGVAVRKRKMPKRVEKKKETHAAWLDTAKLIEGREWEGKQVGENERMEGKLRSEVTYSLTMEWYPKAEHILTEETVGRKKKLRKGTIKDNVICVGGIERVENGIPFEKMLINFHLTVERKTTEKPRWKTLASARFSSGKLN